MKILGLMTGTSMDGIDCCYVDLNISEKFKLSYNIIDSQIIPFRKNVLKKIKVSIEKNGQDNIYVADKVLGEYLAYISKLFIKDRPLDLISMHGQTIFHEDRITTKQIGDPQYLSHEFQKPVTYDFRSKDISLGGTGAPLMPFLDWLLYKNKESDIMTLNIGGISNITYIPANAKRTEVIGFDTGPGMCLIDKFVNLFWKENIDCDAKYSNQGKVNFDLLKFLLKDKFIYKKPPKSLSVDYYVPKYLNNIINKFSNINNEDFLRTLVNYTVKSIAYNIENFINDYHSIKLIVSGGGIKHPLILKDLKETLKNNLIIECSLKNSSADFKESLLMAVMGYTCYKKMTNNMLSVTGARKNESYGCIYE